MSGAVVAAVAFPFVYAALAGLAVRAMRLPKGGPCRSMGCWSPSRCRDCREREAYRRAAVFWPVALVVVSIARVFRSTAGRIEP